MLRLLSIGSGFIAGMLSLVQVECFCFRVANVVFAQLSLVEFELGNYFLEDELHAVAWSKRFARFFSCQWRIIYCLLNVVFSKERCSIKKFRNSEGLKFVTFSVKFIFNRCKKHCNMNNLSIIQTVFGGFASYYYGRF